MRTVPTTVPGDAHDADGMAARRPTRRPGGPAGAPVGGERDVARALARRRQRPHRAHRQSGRPEAQGAQRPGADVGARGDERDQDLARAAAQRADREDLLARAQPPSSAPRTRRPARRAAVTSARPCAVGLRPDRDGVAVGRERQLRRAREAARRGEAGRGAEGGGSGRAGRREDRAAARPDGDRACRRRASRPRTRTPRRPAGASWRRRSGWRWRSCRRPGGARRSAGRGRRRPG